MTDTSCGGRTLVGELVEHRGHGVNGAVQDEERGPVVAPLEEGLVVGAEVVERVLCGGGQGGGHGRARIADVRQLAQGGTHSGQLHHIARITRTQCEKVAVSGHDAVLAVCVAVVCVEGANLSGHGAVGVLGAALAAEEAAQGLVHSQMEHARLGSCGIQPSQTRTR